MFTGIIETQAVLREKKNQGGQVRLTFEVLGRSSPFRLGESVALDGVCLTVSWFKGKKFSADVIPETLQSTALGSLEAGGRVNFERSLRAGDRVGGHFVAGHVDGVGTVESIERRRKSFQFRFKSPPLILENLVPKGSIAIDGVSFTVQEAGKRFFTVGVTPHTFRETTLQWKRRGSPVNLEVDLFAKLVRHYLKDRRSERLKVKVLRRQGF
jgi:riboflavin synthase